MHHHADFQVSGFGGRMADGLSDDLTEDPTAPLLLWNDLDSLVYEPVSGRFFRLGADAALLVEVVLASHSAEQSIQHVTELLHIDPELGRTALHRVLESFDRAGVPLLSGVHS